MPRFRRFKRILKFAVGVLTLFIVLTVIGLVYLARTRVPDLERTVIHPSIKSEVTVVRDDWGVPHIAAANETDAYFALGYCIAQDRLFQMEILRRVAHGELSELLGPLLIPIDKVIRSFRLRPEVEAAIERGECMSPEARQAVDAFMAGVNHRMETEPLPFEYAVLRIPARPFTAADCLCVAGLLSITFAEGLRTEPLVSMLEERHPGLDVDALFPGYTKETPVTIMESGQGDMPGFGFRVSGIGTAPCGTRDAKPETRNPEPALQDFLRATFDVSRLLGPALGSNSWVLGPSRTRFGKPILANDPHIAFTNPGIWYEAHLKFPGFDLYGYYLPPLPFAFLGQNRDRAWAVTMLENDDIDLYRETFKYGAASIGTPLPDGPAKVMYKGQWVDVRQETETIKVRFWPDQQYTVRITPHGPVVTDLFRKLQKYNGPEVSLSWVWQKVPLTYLDAVYKAGHATDCESFGKALALVTSPGINVSYADAQGNIAWWAAGRIVIRPEHVNYKGLLDGASGRDEILGYLPFEQNPCLINPAAGCIVTANNLPTVKPLGPIKQIEGYWQPSDRAARIKQLLDSQDKWSIDELKAVQFDDVLYSAPPFIAAVLEILKPEASGWTLLEQEALNTLETWDCRHDVESIGATVFEVLHDMLVRDTVGDELGPDLLPTYFSLADHWNFMKYAVKEDSLPFWDDVSTPDRKESRKDIVIKAFKDTVNALTRQMGRDIAKWRWGKLHTLEFKHPFGYLPLLGRIFNVGPFPASGAHETINHMLYRAGKLPYNVQAGPSTRRLIDFGQPDRQLDILPTGNAGNFMSPNYADQSEMFMAGQYHEIRLTEDQIRTHKRHEMHFLPVAEMIPLR